MKKTRSLLLTGASVALAAVIALGGTLAYFTDRDAKTNVFTVGNVDIQLNEEFEQGAELVPGVRIEKEATITNTGKNDAWVWMTLAVPAVLDDENTELGSANVLHWNMPGCFWNGYHNQDKYIQSGIKDGYLPEGSAGVAAEDSWINKNEAVKQNIDGIDYNVYTFKYVGAITPGETTNIGLSRAFLDENLDIAPDGQWYIVENGEATKINWNSNTDGNPKIYVAAYGIQEDMFADVEEAYDAYQTQWGENGGVEYPEAYAEVASEAELKAALADAAAGEDLYIKLTADIEWTTPAQDGSDITAAGSVVIDGQGQYTITATGNGVYAIGDNDASITFKNLTVVDESVYTYEDGENAWEFTYLELSGSNTYENVVFTDGIMVQGGDNTFVNCTFMGHNNDSSDGGNTTMYGVWVYDGNATFTNCTFTGTRGMKICDMYDGEVGTVVIDGCTFDSLSEKPGVAIDDEDTQDMNITIKNSTFINCQPGDQNKYVYETDNTEPTTLENNKVENYTSVVEIGTKDELVAFAQRVNDGDGMANTLVKLTADIDLAGTEWTPIGQTGTSYGATNYFQGIFDGQGYTISNMTINETNDGEHYAAGFFGFIDAADATIKDVNFDKATVNGHHWTAVVAGYLTGTVDNCNVTNSTVNCTHANDAACGDKAGAVVGYVNSGLVKNCSVSDTTVSAGRDGGQVVGAAKTTQVSNCTATNVTVTATEGCTGANITNDIIGRNLD